MLLLRSSSGDAPDAPLIPTSAASPHLQGRPWPAFAMASAAGMSTGLGALLVCCVGALSERLFAMTMAFSAGVMMYVSLVAVVRESFEHFARDHAEPTAYAIATVAFFGGAGLMGLTDALVHRVFRALNTASRRRHREHARAAARALEGGDDGCGYSGAHGGGGALSDSGDDSADESVAIKSVFAARADPTAQRADSLAMAAILGIAIALHNLPEGMATYVASYRSAAAGAPLTLAIAVHNIPEGLAVAMAVLHGTGSRTHAIGWATLSGLAEPLGAALAYAFVNPTSSASSFGGMFAVSAGMMVYVCLTELLPAAYREHPSARLVAHAFLAGCAVMASSLVLEKFNNSDSPP